MKRLTSCIIVLVTLLSLGSSCAKRTTIPDSELALIFRDAFLANAYVLDAKIEFDTVQVYQPIFDKYGYSAEDVAYTVGSFSKRKSARLSDVVEQAIKLLEAGESIYKTETTILDSIDAKARRRARRIVYSSDEVTYHSLADSTKLIIEVDDLPAGEYTLRFDYLVDSLDNNRSSYRTKSWVEYPPLPNKKGLGTAYLRKQSVQSHERNFKFDTLTHRLVVQLAESFEVKRTPHVTFRDIEIEYTPPTESAVDQMFREKLDIRIFANEFFNLQAADSLALPSL